MKKRILFLMSDTGGGHRAAAEAIKAAILAKYDADVQLIDVFKNYSPFPLKYMPEFYPWLINHSKSSWGVGYKLSNTRRRAHTYARVMYATMETRLKRMLREHPADAVVCVHSVLTRVSMQALLAQEKRPPFVVVVTDLVSTHYFWYDRRADRTLLPTRPAYERGLIAGVAPERMRVTGLPTHPNFAQSLPKKAEACASLNWDPHLPTFLIVGGGDGMGPIYKTARAINDRKLRCQLVVIAGRNKPLKEQLEASEWNQPTFIYGFMKDMPRLMAAADILVTKAGPATICEACIAGLPMILYDAIPGQEEGNVDYVVDNHAGVFAPTAEMVSSAAATWLANDAAVMRRYAANARALARPNAVWDIADEVWAYAQQPAIVTGHRTIWQDVKDAAEKAGLSI